MFLFPYAAISACTGSAHADSLLTLLPQTHDAAGRERIYVLLADLMDNVEEPLSTLIIDGKLHEGDTVVVESDKSHGVKLRVA